MVRVLRRMDSLAEVGSAVKLGEKRSPPEDGGAEEGAPARKRVKNGGRALGAMRKVAEMVLVLAAMGKMRGGKVPTGAEKRIMATAREKLAGVCELFPPKDVFPRDVFGAIIEDLGLNKVREQRLGVRPPKISIAEKFLLSKRKMEKIEDITPPAANLAQRLHANSGAAAENRASVPAGRVFPTDRPTHLPISSGSFQPSPLGHVAGTNSASIPYQLPTSEVRPMGASGLSSSHLGRDSTSVAAPRIDRPHFRLDGRPNGSTHTSQVQAYSSGDRPSVKAPAWSAQSQPVPSTKIGLEKVPAPAQTTAKVDGTTDAKSGMASQFMPSKPIITQTTPGMHQHFQGSNTIQAPTPRNNHAEISKMVQKLLQPRVSERPVWNPPSREYMDKAIDCQTCKITINDVDTLFVCDACEKGYHLKCLQINSAKGVPRGEWHCDKCLQLSNGKALPPKYGRVLRNINVPKVPSNTAASQSTPDKKTSPLGEKVNHQKMLPNGNSAIQSGPSGNTVSNYSHPTSVSKVENSSDIRGNAIVGKGKMDEKSSLCTSVNNLKQTSSAATISPTAASVNRSCEEEQLESKSQPNSSIPLQQSLNTNHQESCGSGRLCSHLTQKSSQDDSGSVRSIPADTSTTTSGRTDHEKPLLECVNSVDWIGGILKVEEQKAFYQSCCINGIVYKVKDHVLIRFNNRLIPSKLQAMWEDTKMKTKWVTVNRCYFPGDLPVAVGRPCGLEGNEVYESIIGCTLMAGLIQGPCEVLPPGRFTEEKERRTIIGKRPNESLRPLFLCKWIYDESKGLFRDVNC